MHRLSGLLLTLAAVCLGTDWGVQRTDKFEDVGDGVIGPDPPAINSDGGIIYNNFGLAQGRLPNTPQVSGIRPHSGTHDVLTQRPAAGSFATTGRCVVLKELYFGCTDANAQGGVNKPLSCSVTLTSLDGRGAQNGVQKVTYAPNGVLVADQMKVSVTLPPARVVQVNATILGDGGAVGNVGSEASALYLDDVAYTQYDNSAQGVKACGKGF